MPAQALEELRDFHRFQSEELNDAHIHWSPEEAVDEWRRLHPDSQASVDDGDAALKLLRDAVNKGYKDVELKEDTDLDPLRQREDFRKLIADLEGKGK